MNSDKAFPGQLAVPCSGVAAQQMERRTEQAHAFLRLLFGGATDGVITVSHPNRTAPKPKWWSFHVEATKLEAAAGLALALDDGGESVYFGCGIRVSGISQYRRGRGDEVIAVPGVWCDLDLAAPGHAATNLPTYEKALAILEEFRLPPTLAVHSGGGLHVWWLFQDGLWTITNPAERERAERLLVGLQVQFRALMSAHNFHFDSTDRRTAEIFRRRAARTRAQKHLHVCRSEQNQECLARG